MFTKGVVIFNAGYYGGRDFWGVKNVFEPRNHLAKSFGIPTWSLKRFWYLYYKAQNSSKSFRTLLQLYSSFRTPDIDQKRFPKSLTVFLNYVSKWYVTIPKNEYIDFFIFYHLITWSLLCWTMLFFIFNYKYLNPVQGGLFRGCSQMRGEGCRKAPSSYNFHTYLAMMELGTVMRYLKKIKKYINHVKQP